MKRTLCLSLALLFATQPVTAINYQSIKTAGLTWLKSQALQLSSKFEPIRHWVKEHPVLSATILYGGMCVAGGLVHLCKIAAKRRNTTAPKTKTPEALPQDSQDFKFSFVRQESLDLKTKEIYIKNRKGKFELISLSEISEPYIEIVYNTNNQGLSRLFSMGAIKAQMNLDENGKLTIEFPEASDARVDYYVYVPLAMKNTVITYFQAS